ncbi:MAG: hypothetical protein PHZ04_04695 [Patescibacteria group bacterium]|nr:hypothetical protein [Patescibacteria group bacterium]MDD5294788.1 hypothetical protein [Patescibacteria group bacterium]MDD5554286.1 hypothetical protein [Patescibacteria group bacterium]
MSKKSCSFQGVVAYAKPGEIPKEQYRRFATELVAGSMSDSLWKPDGSQASSIVIRKEIWINIGGKGDGLGDGTMYPVFHVYNYLDPSVTIPGWGCLVNPHKKPFRTFRGALRVAKKHFNAALASGKWVTFDQMKAK